jgi:hypothetical protein
LIATSFLPKSTASLKTNNCFFLPLRALCTKGKVLFFLIIFLSTFFFLKEKSCKKEAKNLRFYRL